ncbi:MAG: glycoside hydrolase family 5 protein, partial [Planctomycetota bacterium]
MAGLGWGSSQESWPAAPPRLRGIHVNHEDKVWGEEAQARRKIAEFAKWGANAVRVHLDLAQEAEPRGSLPERLTRLIERGSYRNLFQAVRASDLWLLIDLFPRPDLSGWPPGGWNALWEREDIQREFVAGWAGIAKHFERDEQVIFDLLNESEVVGPLKAQVSRIASKWNDLVSTTIRSLRADSRGHWIAVEPLWGAVHNLSLLERQSDAKVLYSFHFFHPHWFTHQGAAGEWPP